MTGRAINRTIKGANRLAALVLAGGMLAGGLTATGTWTNPAVAAEEKKDFSMRPWLASQLTKAQKALSEKKYKDALEILENAGSRGKMTPHETAMVHQTEGYVYSAQSKYKKAAVAFEKTLATKMVPDQAMKELHFNLAQIYQMVKKPKKSLVHFLRWIAKEKKPKGDDYYTVATAYYRAKMPSKALTWTRKAVKSTRKPKENWLQLITSILFEKKAYRELPPVLNQIATLYPKKFYYDQLFSVLAQLKRYPEALGVYELEYAQGFLDKDSELKNLAMLYIQNRVPLKGAAVVEKGLKAGIIKKDYAGYQLLSECLMGARDMEAALKPLNKAAKSIKGAKSADMYMRVASIHMGKRRWAKARSALNSALKVKKFGERGTAYLLLGIANYRENNKTQAKAAFNKAKGIKTSRRAAKQWLQAMKAQRS